MKYLIRVVLLICVHSTFAQSSDQNFTQTIAPKIPISIANYESNAFVPNYQNSITNIVYRDGLGRSTQFINKEANPDGNDIVTNIYYDDYGREVRNYFPYPASQNNGNYISNAFQQQAGWYAENFQENTPYIETELENSPLNRVKEHSSGGDIWKNLAGYSDHTTKYEHVLNYAFDVKKIKFDVSRIINNSEYYTAYTLNKTIIRNENWVSTDGDLNTQYIYTDKSGKKISEVSFIKNGSIVQKLVRQYVYDNRGLLKYALTPKASDHDFQAYNYTTSTLVWDYKVFLNTLYVGGSGNVTASINNGIVSLNFNANFTSAGLKTGQIVYIDDRIPNSTPTVLSCPGCGTSYSNGYLVYIKDGYLCISTQNPVLTTGFSSTINYNVGSSLTSFNSNQDILDKFAYQYNYDQYNRQIERKDPGRGWEYIVYDQLDRPILTQDANLRNQNLWLFTKYDTFGRVAYTGYYSSSLSRAGLQSAADTYILNNTNNLSNIESRTLTPTILLEGDVALNYSINAFPVSQNILTINYYDDYAFQDSSLPTPPLIIEGQEVTANTKGLETGTYAKTLSGPVAWTKNYTFYDNEGRSIYNYQRNTLGGYTIVSTKYDFRGKIERTVTKHKRTSTQTNPELVITDRFTYDGAERILGQYQRINNQAEEAIAVMKYNDLGTLVEKSVGGNASMAVPLQKISYSYNIRNWLTGINNIQALGNSLFAYKINYHNNVTVPSYATPVIPQYNGNIAQIEWKTKLEENDFKGYLYYYDELNRLKNAFFTGTQNGYAIGDRFSEAFSYDSNGNIITLKRNGVNAGVTTLIDQMTYSYDGNQLQKIEDVFDAYGFTDGLTSGNQQSDYFYDDNGNLIRDRNKGIYLIVYNHLDLVKSVSYSDGHYIEYKYDASGNKISKTYVPVSGPNIVTEYFGDFQYQNSELMFFPTAEGFVSKNGENYTYIYSYRDHLGNTRVNYKGNVSLVFQEDFNSGIGGFTAIGTSIQPTNATGKLKVNTTNAGSGVQKLLLTNIIAGTRINLRSTIDLATTNAINVSVVMNYTNGFAEEQSLGAGINGVFTSDIIAPAALSSIYLKFTKASNSSDVGIPTYIFLDKIIVRQVNLQTLSSTNYYPFGLIHAGEFVSGEASAYNFKFQGKELQNEADFDVYDFGARIYDPSVARWFTPDPQNQFDSAYVAFGNSPITAVDPSGEAIPVLLAGAILGAFVGASTYAMTAMQTENWSWKDFGKATLRGAIIGAISAGISGTAVLSAQGIGESIASGMFTAMAPGKTFQINDHIAVSVTPALATGNATGMGVNVDATVKSGEFSFSAGYGYMSYSDYNGFSSGTESRISGLANYDNGKEGLSLGTNVWGGDIGSESYTQSFNQRTGVIGLHSGDFNAMYENDGGLGIKNLRLGDRGDSYRTAALNISVGDYSAGFNLFTGYRGYDVQKDYEDEYLKVDGKFPIVNYTDKYGRTFKRGYVSERGKKFRLGLLTVGYRGYRVGVNSEHVRHAIQDEVIHGMIGDAGFENQSWDWKPYFQKRTPNMFSSW